MWTLVQPFWEEVIRAVRDTVTHFRGVIIWIEVSE